jgi:hypothetical protein
MHRQIYQKSQREPRRTHYILIQCKLKKGTSSKLHSAQQTLSPPCHLVSASKQKNISNFVAKIYLANEIREGL